LLAARERIYGIRSEKHLTRIEAVNDAFRKRLDENVRVGQHSVSDNGSRDRTSNANVRRYIVIGVVVVVVVVVVLERVIYTKGRKGKRQGRLTGQEGAS